MRINAARLRGLALPSALALLVLVGFALRVWNINFDQGVGSHPDERSTACFYATTIGLPASLDELLDPKKSPLNPLWDRASQSRRGFTYGHFPLYLGVAMGQVMHWLAPAAARVGVPVQATELMARADHACDAIAVAGRLTIALLDTLTIVLVYLLGKRLFGRVAGLAAAAFYAFTAQAIQLSHFFAMDPASTTFTVMAIYAAVRMAEERRLRLAVFAGVAAGLAIASKFSALPILAAPVVAGLLWVWAEQGQDARRQARGVLAIPLALVVAGLTFFLASPYAVLDWENFAQATLVEQGQMVRGVADFPFTRQYRNTTPYIYFIEQQVQWGLGWPLGLLALGGTLAAVVLLVATLVRLAVWLLRGQSRSLPLTRLEMGNVIAWSWIVPYFGLTGAFLAKFNRYMSPILPFVVIFGAGLLWLIWRNAGRLSTGRGAAYARTVLRALTVVGGVGVLAAAIFWSAAYVNGVYGSEHPWLTASRWVYNNAPSGSVILWELWDDPLPKTVPNEPGMDMGSAGLRNIDWSPYEEDTAEKYEILKEKLREADYVIYSSKRIYDSVDELPQRYPMTIAYYDAMWSGELGFELAAEFTSPPSLFGFTFDDRHADESWSLYDHPQVTIFRKVRDLSDAEFDAVLGGTWANAVPYYRGPDSPLSPLLNLLGLGSSPSSADAGLLNAVIGRLTGRAAENSTVEERQDLTIGQPLAALPLVDSYRWNQVASESAVLGVLVWWAVVWLLGLFAWPFLFRLFRIFPDRGYGLARGLGWLAAGWLLWLAASVGLAYNTVRNSWLALLLLGVAGGLAAWRQWPNLRGWMAAHWRLLLVEEAVFGGAYLAFVGVRLLNPDLWQPWFGGEKFMEFAFLNGILRSPSFPPVDPHFAGGYINYYYFGLYLVAYLIKLTGIYAEVAFNLAIPTLFALTVINAYSLALAGWRAWQPRAALRQGIGVALLGPLFVTVLGNLDGFGQIVRQLADRGTVQAQSAIPGVTLVAEVLTGFLRVLRGQATLPGYDFWGPSRVIPSTINEFPYWSFLFADLHPHLIGIPLSLLFIGVLLTIIAGYAPNASRSARAEVGRWVLLGFLLGTLASVNLWELPTYLGLGLLALALGEYRRFGRIPLGRTLAFAALYGLVAALSYWPFFQNYVNVGASGVGLVREGDPPGQWLLIWGALGFIVVSWLWMAIRRTGAAGHRGNAPGLESSLDVPLPRRGPHETGVAHLMGMVARRFDRLPRLVYLHQRLVKQPTLAYLLGVGAVPVIMAAGVMAWLADRAVLGMCLLVLGPSLPLLWRRRPADVGEQLTTLLSVTGLAILAGTQVFFLKDFLQGSDAYRMNTLFKFFVQVWVLWGMAAALALPRLWHAMQWGRMREFAIHALQRQDVAAETGELAPLPAGLWTRPFAKRLWQFAAFVLILVSLTYMVLGTPARLAQRMVGWQPPLGTLNGMDFMNQGTYTWPSDSNQIQLAYDAEAIRWLLANVRGNAVIVESSTLDYYRAGGTRVASMTGLSGLNGMHAGEQRYGDLVGARDALHREFWTTQSIERTEALIHELDIALIYVGQLERHQHPEGVAKLEQMADAGRLQAIFRNEGTVIYAVPGRLAALPSGQLAPVPAGIGGSESVGVGRPMGEQAAHDGL